MIRRISILLLVCICLVACTSIGSFEKGTIKLASLYEKVLDEIEKKEWNLGIMQETSIEEHALATSYGIDPEQIQDYIVYQSVLPADCGEIAIFHIKADNKEVVQKAIHKRIEQMKDSAVLLPRLVAIIEGCQTIEVGEYIVFVSGEDAQKVIQYISSF